MNHPTPLGSTLALLTAGALVAMAAPIAANHAQTESGRTVAFDHRTGNEWWVEVLVAGTDAAAVAKVEAMDTGGAWTNLPRQSWGAYAASFHIEPGNQVRFRATWSDGDVVHSCWFTHPAGAEQCPTSSSTTSTTSSGFDARLSGVRGNEWWVQANVAATGGTLAKVDVRLDNGAWQPLAKQSWGGWAASYRIVQGTQVDFRATSTAGAMDFDGCYTWIPPPSTDAAKVACTHGDPPPNVWNRATPASFGDSFIPDLSIGDADRDGRSELYVPADDALYQVIGTAKAVVSPLDNWVYLAVGDGDNDGKAEVYATRWSDDFARSELHRLSWSGSAWSDQVLPTNDIFSIGPITLGDADNDGRREVYLGADKDAGAQVLQVSFTGSAWTSMPVADLGDDGSFLDIWGFWVGDADRDGRLELAAVTGGRGYASIWIVEKESPSPNVPPQWVHDRLPAHSSYPAGIVAGDVDGDGLGEVAAGDDLGGLVLFHRQPDGAWAEQRHDLGLANGIVSLFHGDGDNDGTAELYLSDFAGHVHQARWVSGAWRVTDLGAADGPQTGVDRVIVGDGDEDGRREVYVSAFDYEAGIGKVVRFSYGPAQPEPAFDATFSGVSGNQWWVQVNVAANQPLHGVEARVNCGQVYKPLAKQSWGGWAASFQIPDGAKVTFRATSAGGSTDVSGGYVWPSATPTGGC